ncbi:diguanylate cyclase [bacterium]|nr:diguanylate cyclase [bacterium]MBU1991119.1 diguanylate cyclase [bacterium]
MNLFKIFFIVFSVSISLFASEKTKIFVLHSYSQEYKWTKSQHNSFVSTLEARDKKFEYYSEYLDTKRLSMTEEYQNRFLAYLKHKYSALEPDLIYVTDDNALAFMYKNHESLFKNKKKIPLFFSGINNLRMHSILPKDTFAGVYEVKEIKQNIELIKQFSPQTRDIYFVGDDSDTYASIQQEIQLQHDTFKNLNFYYLSDMHISKIKDALPNKPRSFVLLTTIGNFKDDNNNTLLPKESIEEMKKNPNLIILSMEDAYMHKGVVGGYVTSGIKQGEEAAKLVIKFLEDNSMQNLSSLTHSPNLYLFDSKELTESRIILSEYISRNATIIGKDKGFIEKNTSVLLNILVTLLFILAVGMILMYAIQRKKCSQRSNSVQEIENLKSKLSSKDQFINNIFSIVAIGYWKLNTQTEELFVSQSLLERLVIDNAIYKDDVNLLSYFIHENDKKLFLENVNQAKETKKTLTFKHKIVSSKKEVFNVTHIMYTEYINHAPSLLIGIIKFEN